LNIEGLGFDSWFQQKLNDREPYSGEAARIIAVDRDRYIIRNASTSVPAELTGRLLYSAETNEDLPCVGDWVLASYYDDNSHAIVHDIIPRRTILRRKSAGQQVRYQLIAANIDVAFIVQSCDFDFNIRRLERYIVMARDGGIQPALLLTKSDLLSEDALKAKISEAKKNHDIPVYPLSNVTGNGLDHLKSNLENRKTYCLIGSSGVGKSTLLNRLLGREEFATNTVREKDSKGRHTTSRRQLTVLECGAMFIDTPGMRELGMIAVDTGLEESFGDIMELAKRCRFVNCSHTEEIGCAVLSAVNAGTMSEERYKSYLKLGKESKYYETSYYEKRKKDKAFGRFIKNAMKYDKRK
jgi:ribosome biogenesis GTPase